MSKKYYLTIKLSNDKDINIVCDSAIAPKSVEQFVSLVKQNYYDGTIFHRVIANFMIQTGGYKIDQNCLTELPSAPSIEGEFKSNGVDNTISHRRGVISMARSSNSYNSASSQFFIMQQDASYLDGEYAAFGQVTSGMEIVDKICSDAVPVDGNGTIPAENQPKIISITIE